MTMNPQIFEQMLNLLEDGTSSGLSVSESLSLPSGIHMSNASPEAIQAREVSPTKDKLLQLVDLVLPSFDLTAGGREHLKDEVCLYFKMGQSPEMVLNPLVVAEKALMSMTPELYEVEKYVLMAQAMCVSMIRDEVAPFYIDWGEQIVQRYGAHEVVQSYIDGFKSLLGDSARA
jgi:hypothetical protein